MKTISNQKNGHGCLILRYSLIWKLVLSIPLVFFLVGSIAGLLAGFFGNEVLAIFAGLIFFILTTYMFIDLYSLELIIDNETFTKRNLIYKKVIRIEDIKYCEEVLPWNAEDAIDGIAYILRSKDSTSNDIKINYPKYFSNFDSFEKWVDSNLKRKKLPSN